MIHTWEASSDLSSNIWNTGSSTLSLLVCNDLGGFVCGAGFHGAIADTIGEVWKTAQAGDGSRITSKAGTQGDDGVIALLLQLMLALRVMN